eukprot:scaffold5357_cov135-Isochrysis_galbana.AAC.5
MSPQVSPSGSSPLAHASSIISWKRLSHGPNPFSNPRRHGRSCVSDTDRATRTCSTDTTL